MKKILLILFFLSGLNAHSRLVLKRSYKYYKLGFDYYKSLLSDNKKKAYNDSTKMCIDVIGTPYMNSIYKDSCLFGVKDSNNDKEKISLEKFLNSPIHNINSLTKQ